MNANRDYTGYARKDTIRLAGFGYKGQYNYFITCCCPPGKQHFDSDEIAEAIIEKLLDSAKKENFSIICYCLMINHLHFVCHGDIDESNLISYMRRFKQITEYYARKSGIEKLWQRSFSDRVIREGDDMSEVVFYVMDNPVRAGLIAEGEDYPYSRLIIEEF